RLNLPTSGRIKILKIKVWCATTFFKVLNIMTFLHKMLKMGQGATKVACHLFFGILALTVEQLLRLHI
ncbi:MAG: hypothetical protein OXC62_07220, partial [Aestuariivita sp.]|nr:hypothetical protein [Aestuariivita sp.]